MLAPELLVSPPSAVAPRAACRIGALGVVTRNRPQAALRCLASFDSHLRAHGRRARMVVVDSSDPGEAEQLRRGLPSLEVVDTLWFGNEQKGRFAERLARASGVDLALVRFALFDTEGLGHDIGANRNCLLLLLAGHPFLSVDDDVVCDLREAPGAAPPRLVVARSERPAAVTLHGDFEAARAALVPREACVLELHERVIGRTVAECLAEMAVEPPAAAAGHDPTAALVGGGGRVVASFGGYYGDCGARFPAFHLWSERSLREQLIGHDEGTTRALVASRQMVRLASALIITTGRFGMFPHVALDATRTLPPFFPVLRGEDLAFSSLLRGCFPSLLFAHVPQAMAHRPWDSRKGDADQLWDPTPAIGAAGLLAQVLDTALDAVRDAPSLTAVGRQLREVSAGPTSAFREWLHAQAASALGRSLGWLEKVLAREQGRPSFWTESLRGYCAYHRAALASCDLGIPLELRGHDDAAALVQRLLCGYGLLLEAWPEIFAAARGLADENRS